MSIGIRNFFKNSATQAVAASTTLVAVTGLTVPVAANQTVCIDYFIPFSVGATGGFRFNVGVPAAGAAYLAAFEAIDGVTASPGAQVAVVITAAADFANAWAVAGNHFVKASVTIVNGANAGNITLQFACNTAANAITILNGAWADVVKL
jgi:hypothetical protein